MRHLLICAGAAASLAAAASVGDVRAAAFPNTGLATAASEATLLQKTQYVWGGRNHCWYNNGWHGPGWYWCGYAWRRGLGWGGGWGWNNWVWRGTAGTDGAGTEAGGMVEDGMGAAGMGEDGMGADGMGADTASGNTITIPLSPSVIAERKPIRRKGLCDVGQLKR